MTQFPKRPHPLSLGTPYSFLPFNFCAKKILQMTPEQFCYWLQGRVELQPLNVPSKEEWGMIGAHLQTVFHKVTPQVKQPNSFSDHMRRLQEQGQTAASSGWYQYPQNMC